MDRTSVRPFQRYSCQSQQTAANWRDFLRLAVGGAAGALILAACGTTAQPTATTAPAPTATTAAVTAKPSGATKGAFSLWHGWTGAELDTLTPTVADFPKANPDAKLTDLAVPFDQLKNKFTTEASTGGGPDVLIGPKDWIGELSKAKLIANVDDIAKTILADLNPSAINANKLTGKVWAIPESPESTEAVALWYNS